ncbi:hypothetical protein D9M71_575460 [compost metagenome]
MIGRVAIFSFGSGISRLSDLSMARAPSIESLTDVPSRYIGTISKARATTMIRVAVRPSLLPSLPLSMLCSG